MRVRARHPLTAILIGVAVGVLLLALRAWLQKQAIPAPDEESAVWLILLWNPANALLRVAPAYLAGLIASRNNGVAGVAAAAICEVIAFGFSAPYLSGLTLDWPTVLSHLGLVVGAGIIGFVSGVAGSRLLPSNNSFKPRPLRGSA